MVTHSAATKQPAEWLFACVRPSGPEPGSALRVYSLHHGAVHEPSSNMFKFHSISSDTFHDIDCNGQL